MKKLVYIIPIGIIVFFLYREIPQNNVLGKWNLCKIIEDKSKKGDVTTEESINFNVCPIISFFDSGSGEVKSSEYSNLFVWKLSNNTLVIKNYKGNILQNGEYGISFDSIDKLNITNKSSKTIYLLRR